MFAEFVKNIPVPKVRIQSFCEELSHSIGVTVNEQFLGVRYYKIRSDLKDKLMQLVIPPKYHNKFDLTIMVINSKIILPHIDFGVATVVNYYMDTSDGKVYFYTAKDKSMVKAEGNVFQFHEVDPVCSIQPNSNDIWILNTSQIHSIECFLNEEKTAFCFQTDIPFEEVVDIMKRFHHGQ